MSSVLPHSLHPYILKYVSTLKLKTTEDRVLHFVVRKITKKYST